MKSWLVGVAIVAVILGLALGIVYLLISHSGSTGVYFDVHSSDYYRGMMVSFKNGKEVPVLIKLRLPMDDDPARLSNLKREMGLIQIIAERYPYDKLMNDSKTRYEMESSIAEAFDHVNKYHEGKLEILNLHFFPILSR